MSGGSRSLRLNHVCHDTAGDNTTHEAVERKATLCTVQITGADTNGANTDEEFLREIQSLSEHTHLGHTEYFIVVQHMPDMP